MNHIQSPIEKQSVTPRDVIFWGPVFFAFISLIILGWADNARGPIYPYILPGLNLSHFQGSLFFATASLVSVLGNFLVPHLLKKISPVSTLCLGLLCVLGFSLGLYFSNSLFKLLLSAISFGLALGTIMVTINIVIDESVPVVKRRKFLLGLHSLYGLSAFMAPITVSYFFKHFQFNWSEVFLPLAIICLPLMGLGFIIHRKYRFKLNPHISELSLTNHKVPAKIIVFWSMALACYVSSELYFSTRIPILYSEFLNYPVTQASVPLSYFFIGLFLGRLINSFLPSSWSGRFILFGSFLISCLWVLISVLVFPQGMWVVGFLMSPCYPVIISEISLQVGGHFKKVSALCIAWSSLAVVGMHIAAGLIADHWGLRSSLYLPFVLLGLVPLTLVFFWPASNQVIAAPQTLTE